MASVPGALAGLFSLETSQIPGAVSHRVRRRHAVYDGGQVDGNGLPRFGSLSLTLSLGGGTDEFVAYRNVLCELTGVHKIEEIDVH
ncbi:hypothetical protein R75483_06236 [Paraburkholderia domus]|nr:hypothetical protein R75483_06236 [Paraburkholderia domus]